MRCKLKDLGIVSTGSTPSKSNEAFYDSEDIGFVKPDILSEGRVTENIKPIEYISEKARHKARVVNSGAVLVTCIGSIGKVGLADRELAFNQQINAIQTNDKVESKYLAYCMLYNKKALQAIVNAPVVPIINKSQFEKFEIEFEENKDKQKKIIEILDKLTAIINNREYQLLRLDDLIKSRFVEMFGDVRREEKFQGIPLREICTTVSGGTPSTKYPKYYEGNIPWISTVSLGPNHIDETRAKAYITEEAIANSATKLIPAGNILFGTRVGVGKSSLNDVEICINQDIVAIIGVDETKYSRLFIKHVLDSYQPYFDSIKKGATILGITGDDLKESLIPKVSLELQKEYEAFVEQTDKLKSEVKKSLDETQLLMDSLMQQYFG